MLPTKVGTSSHSPLTSRTDPSPTLKLDLLSRTGIGLRLKPWVRDERGRRVVHRRRGASRADADDGQPVFDAWLLAACCGLMLGFEVHSSFAVGVWADTPSPGAHAWQVCGAPVRPSPVRNAVGSDPPSAAEKLPEHAHSGRQKSDVRHLPLLAGNGRSSGRD